MPFTNLPRRPVAPPIRPSSPARGATDQIVVGLVNNMPDSALEATAAQFSRLLQAAAGPLTVQLRLAYLPEVPRGADATELLVQSYWPIDELLRQPLDGLIVTGLEPRAPRLTDEPYWCRLRELLAWAEDHTFSSVWSCLAAHAAVQMLDGIERQRLGEKRFGVFKHPTLKAHPLAWGLRTPLCTPHSRWNEVPVAALQSAGYTVVSSSPDNGADLFVKERRSLFVFFQGHPEYEKTTLLKEYRRDIGRFLRGQQPQYPGMPFGYFTAEAAALLNEFRTRAIIEPSADLLASFPMNTVSVSLQNSWSGTAVTIYRNWLSSIAAAKRAEGTAVSVRV